LYYFGEDIYFQAFSAKSLDGELQLISTFKQYLFVKHLPVSTEYKALPESQNGSVGQ
jgi:hypothetical protein